MASKKPREPRTEPDDSDLTVRSILGGVVGAADAAELGLEDLATSPHAMRQLAGVKAVAIHGRRCTFLIQRLRHRVPGFDGWYQPLQREMQGDPLLRYFADLRTQIEKRGLPDPVFADADMLCDGRIVATGLVRIGQDENYTWFSGMLNDPSAAGVARARTAQCIRLRSLYLPNAPTAHLGLTVPDERFETLAGLYLTYLRQRIIDPAREQFRQYIV